MSHPREPHGGARTALQSFYAVRPFLKIKNNFSPKGNLFISQFNLNDYRFLSTRHFAKPSLRIIRHIANASLRHESNSFWGRENASRSQKTVNSSKSFTSPRNLEKFNLESSFLVIRAFNNCLYQTFRNFIDHFLLKLRIGEVTHFQFLSQPVLNSYENLK